MIDIQKLGGPAFPVKSPIAGDFSGMSMRDYFAAKAMQSIMGHGSYVFSKECYEMTAKASYAIADEMLKARSNENN